MSLLDMPVLHPRCQLVYSLLLPVHRSFPMQPLSRVPQELLSPDSSVMMAQIDFHPIHSHTNLTYSQEKVVPAFTMPFMSYPVAVIFERDVAFTAINHQ